MPSHPARLAAILFAATAAAPAQKPQDAWVPHVEPASAEGQQAIARFKLPKGFTCTLWAAEPRCANIVSFCIDHGGDVYVAETFRMHEGTLDLRDYLDWLDEDLACRTPEDRVAMIQRHWAPDKFTDFTRSSERVRWLRDTDGDGVADQDRVFAEDFRDPAAGLGAGLLSWQGRVYYTCMPDLWLLEDAGHNGQLTNRRVLSHGYGVHTAMIGHDLHGLRIGPDGRLYFSCGDRALQVKTERGTIVHTHCGAVLRCNLDGTGLEVFATGLRNPQELVFDEFGNLFTGDNNSDGGDKARWVHVIEGSDSGYRYGYQWQEDPHQRGPWNEEKLWHPHFAGQAAYLVPPIAWLGEGPSGITYYPGTGLTAEYRGKFFTCNFTGGRSSAIFTFGLKPKGASFELGKVEHFIEGPLVTDVEFGPDGALWFSDWVQGWRKTGKGRIYRVTHPDLARSPEVARTQTLLKEGMARRPEAELGSLLAEPDQRVRLAAELELAGRGAAGVRVLADVARATQQPLLARLHALWGLGVAARQGAPVDPELAAAQLADPAPEVRAQAAWLCGELGMIRACPRLIELLADPSSRVQLYAALALGRIGPDTAVAPLFTLAAAVAERDPALRHGVVMGLAGCATAAQLTARAQDANVDARVAAVVALRRQKSAQVAAFLADPDPRVALEAARAGYDLYLADTLPALAARITAPGLETPLLRRVLAACLRVGGAEQARALVRFALDAQHTEALRSEALEHLRRWVDTPGRDPITGEWQPFPRSDAARQAAASYLPALVRELGSLATASEPLVRAWLALLRAFPAPDAAALLEPLLDEQRPASLRAEAFRALTALKPGNLVDAARRLLAAPEVELRVAALEAIRAQVPGETLAVTQTALATGSVPELRFAFDTLRQLGTPAADALLTQQLERAQARLVAPEALLELNLAAEARLPDRLGTLLPQRAAAQAAEPLLAPWLDCLYGGDARKGRKVFRNNSKLSCQRCHRADDDDGGQVGPSLRGLGQRSSRLAILESMVDPNRRITPGYQGLLLELADGSTLAGRIERETGSTLSVRRADNTLVPVPVADVKSRRPDVSAMPEGLLADLPRADLRDLIEFLASLQ